jgi:CheY-like chemotaxis protein
MDGYTRSVLVVEADATERERLAAALEGDGFQVLLCSGPTEPDYTCIGTRNGRCPLATEEAVVVMDMNLDSEPVMMGTPAEDLLAMYLEAGHPVVALASRPREEDPGRLVRLRRHPEKADLTAAVWRLASPRGVALARGPSGSSGPDDLAADDQSGRQYPQKRRGLDEEVASRRPLDRGPI